MYAILFPGQGSQRSGMGEPWQDHPSWRVVERVSDASGRDIGTLLVDADVATLQETGNSQPATFALSLMILDAVRRGPLRDKPPGVVAGHSLGEYSALVSAGALTLEDGARLVAARADAMQQAADASPGTMAAVIGGDIQTIAEAVEDVAGAWVANDNAPGQVVIAGTAEGVEAGGLAAQAAGAKRVIPLRVGGAFHSPLMADAQRMLDIAISSAKMSNADVPVVANVDAAIHTGGFAALLSSQLSSRVRWRESLLTMSAMGAGCFVELGPGTEMSGMVRRTIETAQRRNAATPEDVGRLN